MDVWASKEPSSSGDAAASVSDPPQTRMTQKQPYGFYPPEKQREMNLFSE